jgi:hypothetical protein
LDAARSATLDIAAAEKDTPELEIKVPGCKEQFHNTKKKPSV